MLRGVSFSLRLCTILVSGGRRLLVISGRSVSVPVSGPAAIDIILIFLLTGALLGSLQLSRRRQIAVINEGTCQY